MTDSLKHTPPSKPRHYIIVVHGMGDQKCHTTIPPVVHRFAEVRHPKDESHRKIIVPSTISSHAVRSENERHGWAEFKGIPIEALNSTGHFDGGAATDSSGENFRFVEMYWQDILQDNQEHYASSVEDWVTALLNRLNDPEITPKGWLPDWAVPMLESIVNTAIPLKKYFNKYVEKVFDEFLGDVHLYGDYSRTRGTAVRHFHAVLDKIIFFDFLDWRIQELTVSKLNHEEVIPRPYEKPEMSIIAHSLGSVLSFDAIVYSYVKKHIRSASAENAEFSGSFPFTGYSHPSRDEDELFDRNSDRIDRFVKSVKRHFLEWIRDKVRVNSYRSLFYGIYRDYEKKGYTHEEIIKELIGLNSRLENMFPIEQIVFDQFDTVDEDENEYYARVLVFDMFVTFDTVSEKSAERRVFQVTDEMNKDFRKRVKEDLEIIQSFVKDKIGEGQISKVLSRLEKNQVLFERKIEEIVRGISDSIKRDMYQKLDVYWAHFLDGFSGLGEDSIVVMNDEKIPEIDSSRKKGCDPLLLWRSCIKNFITLGSPIDKYIALWHQNYVHLGLTIDGMNTPEQWMLPSAYQYDFAQIHRINHYNFCDEQDPVGHHLDLTRMTKIYGKIFKNADNAYRDVVFRRYGVPGLAHNMYWSDGELFRGILREIIDRRDDKSSSFFVKDSFREKDNAKKEGFKWAYFRFPALAALITTIIIVFAVFKTDTIFSRSITILLMTLLWLMPSILKFYKNKANVSDVDEKALKFKLQKLFSKGILANILWMAVEWRRIAFSQSEGMSDNKNDMFTRIAFQLNNIRPSSWSFYWRWGVRVAGAFLLLVVFTVSIFIINDLPITNIFYWNSIVQSLGKIGDKLFHNNGLSGKESTILLKVMFSLCVFFAVYILVMLYELNIFIRTKNKYYSDRSGYFGKLLMQLDAMMRSGKQ